MNDRIKNTIQDRFKEILLDEKIQFEAMEKFITDPTAKEEDNQKISKSYVIWEKAFHDLFLEILDFDTGYNSAKTSYTTALLDTGSHENPQMLYQFLDMLTSRMERIHIVKRLCSYLGLHHEMDRIIEHELNLIYNQPRAQQTKTVVLNSPVIAGEIK